MASRQQRVLEIAKQIHEAEARLAKLRAEFSILVPEEEERAPAPVKWTAPEPVEDDDAPPATELVLRAMAAHPGKIFTSSALLKALPEVKKSIVWNACLRLADQGRLTKVGRGRYQLPEQTEMPIE